MTVRRAAWIGFLAAAGYAQTLTNSSLSGKYYFRHLQAGSDANGSLGDVRSLQGTMTFDGNRGYSFTGQLNIGAAAAAGASGTGSYAVNPAGIVSMTNPARGTLQLNARLGTAALIGSSTETTENVFDLFVAVPAPTVAQSTASLAGSYWAASLEIPNGSASQLRSSNFLLRANAAGAFLAVDVNGHAADQRGGAPISESLSTATYAINGDGTGALSFPNSTLLANNKNLYLSRDGSMAIAGSTTPGAQDLLILVRTIPGALSNQTWKDKFWAAGLRLEGRTLSCFAGAANADGAGKLVWSQRVRQVANSAIDFTGAVPYTVSPGDSATPGGTGRSLAAWTAIGAGGTTFVGTTVAQESTSTYELFVGNRLPALSGTGVYLDPMGVLNTASFALGAPISPGQFVSLFGTGLASQTAVASTSTFPTTLGGVQVLIDNTAAPLYFVAPTQVAALVPFATAGTQAQVVVVNNGARSNTVTVPLARTAPGVFAANQAGTGLGAILHADFSRVDYTKPAKRNETILVFLTGLGASSPAVADGAPPPSGVLSRTTQTPVVRMGGRTAQVVFSGLAPCCAGLYQINVTVPANAPFGSNIPLAIETAEHFHDQVDLPIVP
jgi:uncharacterized protein (TIGR03437 family)